MIVMMMIKHAEFYFKLGEFLLLFPSRKTITTNTRKISHSNSNKIQ